MTEWTTTPIGPGILRGATDLERTALGVLPHRLPPWARAQFADEYLARVESQPSGVRLVFRTRATAIELTVLATRTIYRGAPTPTAGHYDLVINGRLTGQASVLGGNVVEIDPATQSATPRPGSPETICFDGLLDEDKDVEIWLPQTETTELIALRTTAPVTARRNGRRVWLHHGSSISQGSTAASPTQTWPAIVAARSGTDLVNLGFSGNALLDPFAARTMRDTPADLISVKIGINLTNTDLMRLRAFIPAVHGFLDTVREGHPHTPLLVISPILCPIQEDTPGPIAPVFGDRGMSFRACGDPADPTRLTLNRIRDELSRIVTDRGAADQHLHYLDGRRLFGAADVLNMPLPDELHPAPAGHRLIGERFADFAFGSGGPFTPSESSLAYTQRSES